MSICTTWLRQWPSGDEADVCSSSCQVFLLLVFEATAEKREAEEEAWVCVCVCVLSGCSKLSSATALCFLWGWCEGWSSTTWVGFTKQVFLVRGVRSRRVGLKRIEKNKKNWWGLLCLSWSRKARFQCWWSRRIFFFLVESVSSCWGCLNPTCTISFPVFLLLLSHPLPLRFQFDGLRGSILSRVPRCLLKRFSYASSLDSIGLSIYLFIFALGFRLRWSPRASKRSRKLPLQSESEIYWLSSWSRNFTNCTFRYWSLQFIRVCWLVSDYRRYAPCLPEGCTTTSSHCFCRVLHIATSIALMDKPTRTYILIPSWGLQNSQEKLINTKKTVELLKSQGYFFSISAEMGHG